jgi:hypothetical protein
VLEQEMEGKNDEALVYPKYLAVRVESLNFGPLGRG